LGKGLDAPVSRVADAGKAEWIKHYTALSTLNWAAGKGSEQTAALVKALIKRLQDDEPLPEALTALEGEQTAERLLGMPVVADIALGIDDKQQVQIKAQRWQWHDKGWKLIEPPRKVLQLAEQKVQLLDLQKSAEIGNAHNQALANYWPHKSLSSCSPE